MSGTRNFKTPTGPFGADEKAEKLLFAIYAGSDCIGKQEFDITDAVVSTLQVPDDAIWAMIAIEADATITDPNISRKVVRFWETGDIPTASSGMPLGDGGIYDVKGALNLKNFKIIGIAAGKTHKAKIQYYC